MERDDGEVKLLERPIPFRTVIDNGLGNNTGSTVVLGDKSALAGQSFFPHKMDQTTTFALEVGFLLFSAVFFVYSINEVICFVNKEDGEQMHEKWYQFNNTSNILWNLYDSAPMLCDLSWISHFVYSSILSCFNGCEDKHEDKKTFFGDQSDVTGLTV